MGVYLPINNYSDMQGPAPAEFHVPSKDEWVALCGILNTTFSMAANATTMGTYLKMPLAGNRDYRNSDVNYVGSYGYYWSSTPYNADSVYALRFLSYDVSTQNYNGRAEGFAVRCFKNSPTVPTSSWTTLYDGSSVASGAGVFWNSTEGLISVSGNGHTWYTIMDKNLGATTVFNQGDTVSNANCGYFYQWGNNYGFAHSGTLTTSSTQVDASNYGPGNYYSSSTFITRTSSPYDRSSVQNDNLWGGVTGVVPVQKELKNAYIGIPDPTSIVLDKSVISLTTVGQTEQLTATIEPTVSDKTITWSSDDTTVATVSTTGLVTCVTPGTCTITATTMNGLTATCSVGQGRLPSAYQEVEWIGSSRTQVINTGVIPTTQTYTAELEVESTQNGSEYWAFGIWGTTGFRGGQDSSGHWDTSFGGSYEPSSYSLNTKTKITMSNAGKGTSSSTAIGLFGMGENRGYSNSRKGAYKIYYCKIWNSGTLIRDFIPCYRIADGVIGMYDVVNDVFYTNSGSGTFTKGPDVN